MTPEDKTKLFAFLNRHITDCEMSDYGEMANFISLQLLNVCKTWLASESYPFWMMKRDMDNAIEQLFKECVEK